MTYRTIRRAAAAATIGTLLFASAFEATKIYADQPSSGERLDEVLVTGVRPGPGLWRVSKGGHDLWILATLTPLPKQMTWRSKAVEARIAKSKVVLAPPEISADSGIFHFHHFPELLSEHRSRDGLTLDQGMPDEFYARWIILKKRYLGRYDERMRPLVAASDLFREAVDQSQLTYDEAVWRLVSKIARRRSVPILPVTVRIRVEHPDAWVEAFNEIPRTQEMQCLDTAIEQIETDLRPMAQRANMWSIGDIKGLKLMQYPDDRSTCFNTLFSVPQIRDQLLQAQDQLSARWLAAADGVIEKYGSSFAVLPIGELLKPGGWIAKLRAKGYAVAEPQ